MINNYQPNNMTSHPGFHRFQMAPCANTFDLFRQSILLATGSLLLALTGCASSKITEYHPPTSAATERVAEKFGAEVGVDPFVEKERTEKYFDLNAVGSGIAILHVHVTNKTADKTLLVEKKDFRLMPVANGWANWNTPPEPAKKLSWPAGAPSSRTKMGGPRHSSLLIPM
jgi:hypothetical protein